MQAALIAIVGRAPDTVNYERALKKLGAAALTTLEPERCEDCAGLLLPGGGDITPAFFGQSDRGSRNIDTELDIRQLWALEYFIKRKKPVLGVCKGFQLINVYFGGTIFQHDKNSGRHEWIGKDQYHYVNHIGAGREDFFNELYGRSLYVNSAHHQAIDRLGEELIPLAQAYDGTLEAFAHEKLPVFGVQWHPERIMERGGERLLKYFIFIVIKILNEKGVKP